MPNLYPHPTHEIVSRSLESLVIESQLDLELLRDQAMNELVCESALSRAEAESERIQQFYASQAWNRYLVTKYVAFGLSLFLMLMTAASSGWTFLLGAMAFLYLSLSLKVELDDRKMKVAPTSVAANQYYQWFLANSAHQKRKTIEIDDPRALRLILTYIERKIENDQRSIRDRIFRTRQDSEAAERKLQGMIEQIGSIKREGLTDSENNLLDIRQSGLMKVVQRHHAIYEQLDQQLAELQSATTPTFNRIRFLKETLGHAQQVDQLLDAEDQVRMFEVETEVIKQAVNDLRNGLRRCNVQLNAIEGVMSEVENARRELSASNAQ